MCIDAGYVAEGLYDDAFEVSQILVQVLAMMAQVQDGVHNQLPWPMICDLSSPLCAVQREWRIFDTEPQVFGRAAGPQRVCWRVLQDGQRCGNAVRSVPALGQSICIVLLPSPRLFVVNLSMMEVEYTHWAPCTG